VDVVIRRLRSGQRDAARAQRHSPVGAEAGDREVSEHEQEERRRRAAVSLPRQTERSLAQSSKWGRWTTTTPRMYAGRSSHDRSCGSSPAASSHAGSGAKTYFVEHVVCTARTDSLGDAAL
jgi:hypothetical protein